MDRTSAVKRRVVVSGMGAVSPNGVGREAFWNATRRGHSGVRRITRFDASRHQVQIAGEVADFDESAYVEAKERHHVSRAVPLAIAAAREAVTDAGIEPARMSRDELRTIGVLIGSGGGSQEFTEEQYRLYYSGHEKQCSVYTIPTSTIGTLASEISMRFGFRGPSHIVSTGCTSSTDAGGRGGRTYRAIDSPGFHDDAYPHDPVEPGASAGLTTVFKGPQRLCTGGGRVVLYFGRSGACASARREDLRRDRGVRLDLRGVPSRAAGGVRRGARTHDDSGDG
jgi:hypothetical protein